MLKTKSWLSKKIIKTHLVFSFQWIYLLGTWH